MHIYRALACSTAALLCLAAIAITGAPAAAGGVPTVVYPTGAFPQDVQNAQAAVDLGGVVVLKATNTSGIPTAFNFGPSDFSGGGLVLTTDVDLEGETVHGHQTTIQGGWTPVLSFDPLKTRIAHITFKSPLWEAILLGATRGAQIVGNTIDGVVGVTLHFPKRTFTFGDGIDLGGAGFSGQVIVADNVIKNLTSDFSSGMQIDTSAATTTIANNTVDFPASNGTVENDGFTLVRIDKPITISGNHVHLGTGRPDATPLGMILAGNEGARYRVFDNVIVSEHPNAYGIAIEGGIPGVGPVNGAVIANNRITLSSTSEGTSGILLLSSVNSAKILANKISGTAFNGLAATWGDADVPAANNQFIGNDLQSFDAAQSDVFLDDNTINTRVIGNCRSAIDLGTHNQILCTRMLASHVRARRAAGLSNPMVRSALRESVAAARIRAAAR